MQDQNAKEKALIQNQNCEDLRGDESEQQNPPLQYSYYEQNQQKQDNELREIEGANKGL